MKRKLLVFVLIWVSLFAITLLIKFVARDADANTSLQRERDERKIAAASIDIALSLHTFLSLDGLALQQPKLAAELNERVDALLRKRAETFRGCKALVFAASERSVEYIDFSFKVQGENAALPQLEHFLFERASAPLSLEAQRCLQTAFDGLSDGPIGVYEAVPSRLGYRFCFSR